MMIKMLSFFLLLLASGTIPADEDVRLPGERLLGQIGTDCDGGKANNDPRLEGKREGDDDATDGDGDDGGKTQDI